MATLSIVYLLLDQPDGSYCLSSVQRIKHIIGATQQQYHRTSVLKREYDRGSLQRSRRHCCLRQQGRLPALLHPVHCPSLHLDLPLE